MEGLKTVKDYCDFLGWNASELSRQAGITWEPANNAVNERPVSARVKRDIVAAFSRALGETIQVGEITWISGSS